jgi:GGDEF domain-containing protein
MKAVGRRDVGPPASQPDGSAVAITTGVAASPEDGADLDDLVHAADLRLYTGRRPGGAPAPLS